MIIPLLTLLFVYAQDPQPPPPLPVQQPDGQGVAGSATSPQGAGKVAMRLDQIELHVGEVLEGRIVLERSNYVEIELGPGAIVGFRTSVVRSIRRGAGALVAAVPEGALAARDQWFVLNDASGRAVGWLHSTVSTDQGGGSRVLEEWEFSEGRRYFQITMLETTSRDQQPVACYFRERITEEVCGGAGNDPLARTARVREERIVEATVDNGILNVRRLSGGDRRERSLPWPQAGSFPLLARVQNMRTDVEHEVTVFDPAAEELQTRTFTASRQRRVSMTGSPELIDEVVEYGAGTSNAIWRDASSRIVRREISGPALTAWPSDAGIAQRAVRSGQAQPPLFVAEPQRRFGLWRPNPAWQALSTSAGSLSLACSAHDATITMALIDHLDVGATLDEAAAAVERWFRLLEPGLEIDGRVQRRVRRCKAVHIAAHGGIGLRKRRALMVVVPWQDRFVVVRCQAPTMAWAELECNRLLWRREESISVGEGVVWRK